VARIEIALDEMAAWLHPEQMQRVSAAVHGAGFQYVAMDCDGYRSGSMNEVLPVEVLLGSAKR
jgi:pyridinium-3,5-biscarboxylic acid mononucleotide sulfurtransferase